MIRVAVLDDHPLAVAALEDLLGDTADVHSITATAGGSRIPETAPDVREDATGQPASSDVPVASALLTGTSCIDATLKTDSQDVVRSVGWRRPTVRPRPRPMPNAYCWRCHGAGGAYAHSMLALETARNVQDRKGVHAAPHDDASEIP